MAAATPSHRKAAAWMAGWLTAMLVMAVAGREATRTLHVFQIMEMRSVLGFVLLWPLLHASGGIAAMRTRRLGRHVARNAVHYAAQFGWFFALTMIPIAQVVAIEFTMPIWTALLAVAFLGERLGAARVVAVALGLVGVAVIVRPGLDHVDPGQLIALAAAVGFAAGSGGHRPPAVSWIMVTLIVVLIMVVLDLDRPRRGLIEVSKQSLYDLQASIGPPLRAPGAIARPAVPAAAASGASR